MDEIYLPIPASPSAFLDSASAAQRLLSAWMTRRNPQTLRAYTHDIRDYAAFVGLATPELATAQLLAAAPGQANELALRYRGHLLERGLAAATINRRLAALRSLVKLGRTLGMCSWSLG